MRSDDDLLDLILATARADERIRALVLSGSRADPTAPSDALRDFDVVCVVSDVESFRDDRDWIDAFGETAIVQHPDTMFDTTPRSDGGTTTLMQFTDGHRIDLTLLPLQAMAHFRHDGPAVVPYDPDGVVPPPPPTGARHHVPAPPTADAFADTCNEFWWLAPYVAKGLVRGETTYARHHLDTVMRAQLMRVLGWWVATASGFTRGPGKAGRFLRRELDPATWTLLQATYADADLGRSWNALEAMTVLFRRVARDVAVRFDLAYPERDDERVTTLLRRMRARSGVE
ncbi:MAG: aminoglycoside 6-adenylyltransferase [Trueperaceae bacterium]|nr:aminoglycoside 6-adenylyltransferase [Trueperaceae bacterium]